VAKGFFWQTPGSVLPYCVALVILLAIGKTHYGASYMLESSVAFRLLLGLGAVPTLIAMLLTYHSAESREYEAARTSGAHGPLRLVRQQPHLLRRLVGCGLSWLLYDFVYYGTAFNQVALTSAVFGSGETLFDSVWQNIVLTLMGFPGVVLAIAALHGWSSRKLQVCGFALMAAACLALAAAAKLGADETTKFALFCVVLFAINWGPNVSTYCLPAEVFPTAVRSSCFGVCAGMGKVGAIIGAASFEAINTALGLQGVYLICAVVSIAGLLVTVAFVPTEVEVTEGEASGSLEPAAAAAPFEQSPASSIQSSLLPPAHKDGGASA